MDVESASGGSSKSSPLVNWEISEVSEISVEALIGNFDRIN
jgi:hypothetical protein